MYTTLSGQMAAFKKIEVIANNLANMNTAGFKSEKLMFEKALKEQRSVESSLRSELPEPGRLDTDEFVNVRGTYTDFSQGSIKSSGNPLDVAIQGEGFFVLNTPEGERYTRAGEFSLDSAGRLVAQDGSTVQGAGGEIFIEGGQVTIEKNGGVLVNGETVGQIRVVQLAEGGQLMREAKQRFRLEEGAVFDVANVRVQGGALEGSNVNAVLELTEMIMASRLFEAMESTNESSNRMSRARNEVFNGQS